MTAQRNALRKTLLLVAWIVVSLTSMPAQAAQPSLRILCSTFPIYQFTRNIVQGRQGVSVSLMLPAQLGCPHDYALTPKDMQLLASADVFIINGLGLEQFLGEPLKHANPSLKIIDSSQGVPGIIAMAAEPDGESGHDDHEHAGANPHLFASPRQSVHITASIAEALGTIDPDGRDLYRKNSAAYSEKLTQIADEFKLLGTKLVSKKIITQHGVFDYLARDMGLEIVAVVEPHAGQEPSAAEMLSLIKTAKAKQAAAIFAEPQYPSRIIETIAKEAGIPSATLDPVATGPDHAGLDYYERVMRRNMVTLSLTLGVR